MTQSFEKVILLPLMPSASLFRVHSVVPMIRDMSFTVALKLKVLFAKSHDLSLVIHQPQARHTQHVPLCNKLAMHIE